MRAHAKQLLAKYPAQSAATGMTMLIYHRVGGQTPDERDISVAQFSRQMRLLRGHRVLGLDDALDELAAGDTRPKVVITFDDGFADVHTTAWPLLHDNGLPFTLYLSTAYVGGQMHWEGSTAKAPGPALTWDQLGKLAESPLCTIGNHTHTHARPEHLSDDELDLCTKEIDARLGITPRHFAYTWGVSVPRMEQALRSRFRSAATGRLGRNTPSTDPMQLWRVPVRGSDPLSFFAAKLSGSLVPERTYDLMVRAAKRVNARA
jgi:peptidoglycan/xylan/chitin deacetylase (PgdA/CDA1 family)